MENKSLKNNRNKYIKDMTKGEPIFLLLGFAIPLLIGNFFTQAYNLAEEMGVTLLT